MSSEDRFEFYKEVYLFEHERKNSLLNAHGIPIGLLSVLLGVIGFYINDFIATKPPIDWLFWVFIFFFTLTILVILAAFFFLIYSYTGHQYGYIPYLNELHKFDTANKKYHKNTPDKADKEFYDNLVNAIVETTTHNSQKNTVRSGRLFKANTCLVIACFCMGLSAIPYFTSKAMHKKEQTHNIKIINFNENNKNQQSMLPEDDNNDSDNNDTEDAKPEFPPTHYIYEGSIDYDNSISKDSNDNNSSNSESSDQSKKDD